MKISVALCTYNGERFVAEQLRSILTQSTPVNEIVISDDGSKDATLDRVREVLDSSMREGSTAAETIAPKVTILKNASPLGVTRNFEQAVLACTGDLIVLCDQDDVWPPHRVERAVSEFENRPDLLLAFSDAHLVDDSGEQLGGSLFDAIEFSPAERRNVNEGRALKVLLQRNVATGATIMFRRSVVPLALPFPESWVHDEWLAMIAAIHGQIDFIDEPLIDYRQHDANQIGATRPTLKIRLARLQEPRRPRNRRLLARAEALLDHVTQHRDSLPKDTLTLAHGKVVHEQFRSGLPAVKAFRVIAVLRMAASGSYRLFGRARYDIPRDLLQPDR